LLGGKPVSLSVSNRVARIQPSATGAVLELATELKEAGHDVINMGAGEPDFDTPQWIKTAAIEAIRLGETKYTPIGGTRRLRSAIQQKFSRDNGLDFEDSQILVSCGGKQSLFNLCLALLNPGDEVLIPAPYWVSYPQMVRVTGAKPVEIWAGLDQDFKVTPRQLREAISTRTRLLILNSPSNPTGTCYEPDELKALGAVLEEFPEVAIVSDEIYEVIHWDAQPFMSFAAACPRLADRTVTVNGVSKAYAMTGWRIGFAGGPPKLISAMSTIQSQSTTNACSISQAAAAAALEGDQGEITAMVTEYRRRHDFLIAELNSIRGFECRPGQGTFYAFPRVDAAISHLGVADDSDLCRHLLNESQIALVPGSAFGAPGYVRFSFACAQEVLEDATFRLKRAMGA
jgi:aspartate aminotransferase